MSLLLLPFILALVIGGAVLLLTLLCMWVVAWAAIAICEALFSIRVDVRRGP